LFTPSAAFESAFPRPSAGGFKFLDEGLELVVEGISSGLGRSGCRQLKETVFPGFQGGELVFPVGRRESFDRVN
jgi:hypothetical protein